MLASSRSRLNTISHNGARRPRLSTLTGLVVTLAPLAAAAASLGISSILPLSFGRFVAANGSLTLAPSGTRVASGGVTALQTDPGQPAQFLVTGDPDTVYAISLPVDGTVSLSNGTQSMPVNGFTSSPGATGVLPGGGSQVLRVGARLDVVKGVAYGGYTGSFQVVVDYN
jgi:hypothetical protein